MLFKVVNVNCFSNKINYRKKVYCKSDAYAVQFVVMDLNYIDCSCVQNHMLAEFFSLGSMSILCLRGARKLFLLFFGHASWHFVVVQVHNS
jgi:hypothetical protein